jgi:hypothetical protein
MSEHTPGPWRIKELPNGMTVVVADDGTIIFECIIKNLNKIEEMGANFKLAAAAPELLRVVENIFLELGNQTFISNSTLSDLERVIKKAKGVE